jgi:hypothetical protein
MFEEPIVRGTPDVRVVLPEDGTDRDGKIKNKNYDELSGIMTQA